MSSVTQLGYVGFEVGDLEAWARFAELLGLGVERRDDGSLALRLDEHAQRIAVEPGTRDDLCYAGFEVADAAALDALVERAAAAGFAVTPGKPETAAARRVERLVALEDPNGVPVELYVGALRLDAPFRSPHVGRFVTGDEGLGHVVFPTRDPDATEHFYCDVLGLRLSDRVRTPLAPGRELAITFLHANARHHTVAFVAAPLPKRIHHVMLEVDSPDDVGRAYDRCLDAGVPIQLTLGRHSNDGMFSFYVTTPSGFAIEFGAGGRKVDDASWRVRSYDKGSSWGHRPPAAPAR